VNVDCFLDGLHDPLANEIESLKRFMVEGDAPEEQEEGL